MSCEVIDPNGAIRYDQSMDATQNARSFSKDSLLRRYVLDSLAVGRSVSVQTSDGKFAAGLFEIGNQMGAKISVCNSTDPRNAGVIIKLESGPGSAHFDLYSMN